MLFDSIEFMIFLPVVFILYWFLVNKKLKAQNAFLLIASYFFYGWWDYRFLGLLIMLSLANYYLAIGIEKNINNARRKIWFILALVANLGTLCLFKYYNFFIEGFVHLISLTGYHLPLSTTKIILPLGISFYVFLSLSYILDVYKENLAANKNVIEVLLSLSFFPIIVAGPIQRPSLLLPQIQKERVFNYDQAVDGLRQIIWGLFTKIAIADKSAAYVENIFSNASSYSGSTLLVGIVLYSVQIYADFSGYSNIAIGTAKLFGFNLMRNFAYPYFSRDITEFWKRWHISLTMWFRDYVFLPISFSVSGKIKSSTSIYIVAGTLTWFFTGLWHGANYTFICWGMIHCFFLVLYHWQQKPRKKFFKKIGMTNSNILIVIPETVITILIVMTAWVFFRADSVGQAVDYIGMIFSRSLFTLPEVFPMNVSVLVTLFIAAEWLQRQKDHALQVDNLKFKIVRWAIYYIVVGLILFTLNDSQQGFIYSQF
jgi:alginate O-acetyltransferase complex protein AlgI